MRTSQLAIAVVLFVVSCVSAQQPVIQVPVDFSGRQVNFNVYQGQTLEQQVQNFLAQQGTCHRINRTVFYPMINSKRNLKTEKAHRYL